jgi:hypothetical protein
MTNGIDVFLSDLFDCNLKSEFKRNEFDNSLEDNITLIFLRSNGEPNDILSVSHTIDGFGDEKIVFELWEDLRGGSTLHRLSCTDSECELVRLDYGEEGEARTLVTWSVVDGEWCSLDHTIFM